MYLFLRFNKLFILLLPIYLSANVQNPTINGSYMARVYTQQDLSYSIKNGACRVNYNEVTMENKVPIANKYLTQFQYSGSVENIFYHPYLGNISQYILKLQLGFDSRVKAIATIPINMDIPEYVESLGIVLGGDGYNEDILYIILKENNKTREIPLKEVFQSSTFHHYIIPIGKNYNNSKRILEKLVVRHHFNKTNRNRNAYALIGNIYFYAFHTKRITKTDFIEPITSPLHLVSNRGENPQLDYQANPYGGWNQDDTLNLTLKQLTIGSLELYMSLQDRITKNFLIRIPVSNITNNKEVCLQVKLPNDVITYQQKNTNGRYFLFKGLKYFPAEGISNIEVVQAFFQKQYWKDYQYPIDK